MYLLPNTEVCSTDLPQAKLKNKQAILCHRADKFLTGGMQDPKLLWHISCTLTQNSTGRNNCLTFPSTDNKHHEHMGCISLVRRADKLLIYLMLSETGSILWLKRSPINSGFHEDGFLSLWKEIYLEICCPETYEKFWVTTIFRNFKLKQSNSWVLKRFRSSAFQNKLHHFKIFRRKEQKDFNFLKNTCFSNN